MPACLGIFGLGGKINRVPDALICHLLQPTFRARQRDHHIVNIHPLPQLLILPLPSTKPGVIWHLNSHSKSRSPKDARCIKQSVLQDTVMPVSMDECTHTHLGGSLSVRKPGRSELCVFIHSDPGNTDRPRACG